MALASEQVRESPAQPFRSLADVQALLDSRINYEADRQISAKHIFTLDRMVRCVEALGRPDRTFRTIHVTGTKGKGSVSRLLAALLLRAGLRVGLYTSPHVEHLRERIAVDGTPIGDTELVSAFNVLAHLDERLFRDLTVFELLTAAAFWVFREARSGCRRHRSGDRRAARCDECDQPGRVRDHHYRLRSHRSAGRHAGADCRGKAGIIKPGVPLVCRVTEEGPGRVIAARAVDMRAPVQLYQRDYDVMSFLRTGYRGVCSLRVGRSVLQHLVLSTPARFMATNAAHCSGRLRGAGAT